ncbi:MAG: GNAT family N-acetyltransferase [Tannerellaceae bacterium]|jgi:diamine N-acetyltransferase|nr:GNAT family N-acetyltransferase [Tannerellaceae bacterium]
MAFLKDETVQLRALEPEDLPFLYRWENDTDLWTLGNTVAPYSRHTLTEYLADARRDVYDTRQLRLVIETLPDHLSVGLIDLFDLDIHNQRAAVGIFIIPAYRKKGIGAAALRLLADYAFRFLHLHQLYAHVPADNAESLALFRHCGYQSGGRLSQWAIHPSGLFADVFLLQLISSLGHQSDGCPSANDRS